MGACITHIGTALPAYQIAQADACRFMQKALQLSETESRKLKVLYRASKIQTRYSVLSDYQEDGHALFPPDPLSTALPTTATRMRVYEKEAPLLGTAAAEQCLPADFDRKKITHLITVSCTGMYAPGLDIDLIHSLGLSLNTHRIAIQFMGCYAAFNALKTAHAICLSDAKAKVLIVSVELCSLHFSTSLDHDSLLANALFADGAAAALVESGEGLKGLHIEHLACTLFPQGAKDMAWRIGDFGFEMRLSSYIPQLLQEGLGGAVEKMLEEASCSLSQIAHYAIHPGGARILQAISQALGLEAGKQEAAYQVLRDCGNMSSATIFFVWKKLLEQAAAGKVLSLAFGPGLTAEMAVLRVVV